VTVLRNNFDGGTDGLDITASNSGSGGNPFDGIFKSGSGIVKYASASTLERPTSEYVARIGTGTPEGQALAYWFSSMGSQSQIWLRFYARYSALPDATETGFQYPAIFTAANGSDIPMVKIGIKTVTHEVFVVNGPATSTMTTSGSISLDKWFRIEARIQFSSTTGNGEVRWYDDADSDVYAEQLTFSSWNLQGSAAAIYYYGCIDFLEDLEDVYLASMELNNEGWPGPAPFRQGRGVPSGNLTNSVAIHMPV
jgi:hypothetical protein